jgi:hypothetical protein
VDAPRLLPAARRPCHAGPGRGCRPCPDGFAPVRGNKALLWRTLSATAPRLAGALMRGREAGTRTATALRGTLLLRPLAVALSLAGVMRSGAPVLARLVTDLAASVRCTLLRLLDLRAVCCGEGWQGGFGASVWAEWAWRHWCGRPFQRAHPGAMARGWRHPAPQRGRSVAWCTDCSVWGGVAAATPCVRAHAAVTLQRSSTGSSPRQVRRHEAVC